VASLSKRIVVNVRRASWGALLVLTLFVGCGATSRQTPQAASPQVGSGAREVALDTQAESSAPRGDRADAASAAGRPTARGALDGDAVDAFVARGAGWVLHEIQLEPVIAAGRRFLGFRIVQIFDNSPAVLRFGVRPNDIIRSVNGLPLVRPDDLVRILAVVRGAEQLDVRVLRDARQERVVIPIERAVASRRGRPETDERR
jgi:hypothetical protein